MAAARNVGRPADRAHCRILRSMLPYSRYVFRISILVVAYANSRTFLVSRVAGDARCARGLPNATRRTRDDRGRCRARDDTTDTAVLILPVPEVRALASAGSSPAPARWPPVVRHLGWRVLRLTATPTAR